MFSWFKFDWLKSRPEPVETKSPEEEDVIGEMLKEMTSTEEKLYKNILYSNGIVTVVMNDGTVLSKSAPISLVEQLKKCTDQEMIFKIMGVPVEKIDEDANKGQERKEEQRVANKGIEFLADHEDFIVNGTSAFLKGVKLELPPVIIASFAEIIANMEENTYAEAFQEWEKYFRALKMFWLQLALSPLEQCREDLLTFVKKNDVRITPNGNLVLYRRIVSIGGMEKPYTRFVSQEYFRIKKWKKSPKNYFVVDDYGEYKVVNDPKTQGVIGSLYDLYHTLAETEENKFTSSHNKGKHIIKIGSVYKIPDTQINLDNGLCAAGGLHAAAVDYNYSSFGDTPVVVLVNPSKAITVPKNETGKLRTTEMFIAAINDKPFGVHWDDDALAAVDEEYHQYTLLELEEILATMSFEKLVIEDNLPDVSMADVQSITDMLRNRVKPVVV